MNSKGSLASDHASQQNDQSNVSSRQNKREEAEEAEEVKITTEFDEYENMLNEQKERFEKHLRFSVNSALTYTGTESQPEDWIDTHERTAQLIIELQRHAKSVAEHLAFLDTHELVSSLRAYTEENFQRKDETVASHKNFSDE